MRRQAPRILGECRRFYGSGGLELFCAPGSPGLYPGPVSHFPSRPGVPPPEPRRLDISDVRFPASVSFQQWAVPSQATGAGLQGSPPFAVRGICSGDASCTAPTFPPTWAPSGHLGMANAWRIPSVCAAYPAASSRSDACKQQKGGMALNQGAAAVPRRSLGVNQGAAPVPLGSTGSTQGAAAFPPGSMGLNPGAATSPLDSTGLNQDAVALPDGTFHARVSSHFQPAHQATTGQEQCSPRPLSFFGVPEHARCAGESTVLLHVCGTRSAMRPAQEPQHLAVDALTGLSDGEVGKEDVSSAVGEGSQRWVEPLLADSVMRKRKRKMNKHKHRKRRKKLRHKK